jgi:hypothetical protein
MAIREKIRYADGSGVPAKPGDQAKSHHHPPSSVQPVEAEDPKESAGNQHLQKKVLNENVEGGAAQQHPESPAGQHATGSFIGPTPTQPLKTPKKNGQR